MAGCRWVDGRCVIAYLPSAIPIDLSVGSTFNVVDDTIRARCDQEASICASWPSIKSSGAWKSIDSPSKPAILSVSITAPGSISSCSDLLLDLSAFTGSAGRNWRFVNITVSLESISELNQTQLELSKYLATAFRIDPPAPIPSYLLPKSQTLTFFAKLCNFLGACGNARKNVVVSSSPGVIPTVLILGPSQRTILASSVISLTSMAYTLTCGGKKSVADLKYTWAIRLASDTTGQGTLFASQSQDTSKFTTLPYQLEPERAYQVVLTVEHLSSRRSASASVTVSVIPGDVEARIRPNSDRQVLQATKSLKFDASQSFDRDKPLTLRGVATGLEFQWLCIQTEPDFSSRCSLLVADSDTGESMTFDVFNERGISAFAEKVVVTAPETATGTVNRLSLVILGNGRTKSSSPIVVNIRVQESAASRISIGLPSALQSARSINVNEKLVLSTDLNLFAVSQCSWSIDEGLLNLESVALTPISQTVSVLNQRFIFNLIISPNTLPERSSLTFILSCAGRGERASSTTTSAITVPTNGSPIPGKFNADPLNGRELTTIFSFYASRWTDIDLPLSFEYGFVSPASLAELVILSRSELAYFETKLPGGAETDSYHLNATLQVYDSLSSASNMVKLIQVSPVPRAEQQKLLTELVTDNENSANVANRKQTISTLSTVLNTVNCSLAPNCTAFGRFPCLATENTCGKCSNDYFGDGGDMNTPCVYSISYSARVSEGSIECTTDADCLPHVEVCAYDEAVTGKGTCTYISKSCRSDCSGRGTCFFADTNTGEILSSCKIGEDYCEAICQCRERFSGAACDISETDLGFKQYVRSFLISSLRNLTTMDDIDVETITSWSASLYTISLQPFEISILDIPLFQEVALKTVQSAIDLGVKNYDQMVGVLQAVDNSASISRYNYLATKYFLNSETDVQRGEVSINLVDFNNSTAAVLSVVSSLFVDLIKKNSFLGENSTNFMYMNFKMTTVVVSADAIPQEISTNTPFRNHQNSISLRQSEYERTTNSSAAAVVLVGNSNLSLIEEGVPISLIEIKAKSFGDMPLLGLTSNPVRIKLPPPASELLKSITELVINIPNNNSITSYTEQIISNFTTYCNGSDWSIHEYQCSDSGTIVSHTCNSSLVGTYLSHCPKPSPTCARLNITTLEVEDLVSSGLCRVANFSSTWTTCVCSMDAFNGQRQARQSSRYLGEDKVSILLDESGVSDMVSMSVYSGTQFADTFQAANSLNSEDGFRRSLTLFLLFSSFWVIGGASFFYCQWKKHGRIKNKSKQVNYDKQQRRSGGISVINPFSADIQRHLITFIEEFLPAVFSNKPFFERLLLEIRRHHPYFMLFSARVDYLGEYSRGLLVIQLLTTQSMLMFILTLLYDIEFPKNDGSCSDFLTEANCTKRRLVFDSSQSYCSWNPDNVDSPYDCTYTDPNVTMNTVIYVVIFSLIFTSFIGCFVDKSFKILHAPLVKRNEPHSSVQVPPHDGSTPHNAAISVSDNSKQMLSVPAKPRESLVSESILKVKSKVMAGSFVGEVPEEQRQLSQPFQSVHQLVVPLIPLLSSADLNSEVSDDSSDEKQDQTFSREIPDRPSTDGLDEQRTVRQSRISEEERLQIDREKHFEKLKKKVIAYRTMLYHLMKEYQFSSSAETIEGQEKIRVLIQDFDKQWGILPVLQNSYDPQDDGDLDLPVTRSDSKLKGPVLFDLRPESEIELLKMVQAAVQGSEPKLKKKTHRQAGVDILQFFILDMLGSSSIPAHIFTNKFDEEFEYIKPVTYEYKVCAGLFLLCFNFFCCYYLLLVGLQRGNDWQNKFLIAFILQFIIEVFLHAATPLVGKKKKKKKLLDAPSFLFVSNKLAKQYPYCIESMVVLNYCSPLPGSLMSSEWLQMKKDASIDSARSMRSSKSVGKIAPVNEDTMSVAATDSIGPMNGYTMVVYPTKEPHSNYSCLNYTIGIFTYFLSMVLRSVSVVYSMVLASIITVAALPYIYQKTIVQILEPILLSGIMLLGLLIMKDPVALSLVIVSLVFTFIFCYMRFSRTKNQQQPHLFEINKYAEELEVNEGGNNSKSINEADGSNDKLDSLRNASQTERNAASIAEETYSRSFEGFLRRNEQNIGTRDGVNTIALNPELLSVQSSSKFLSFDITLSHDSRQSAGDESGSRRVKISNLDDVDSGSNILDEPRVENYDSYDRNDNHNDCDCDIYHSNNEDSLESTERGENRMIFVEYGDDDDDDDADYDDDDDNVLDDDDDVLDTDGDIIVSADDLLSSLESFLEQMEFDNDSDSHASKSVKHEAYRLNKSGSSSDR